MVLVTTDVVHAGCHQTRHERQDRADVGVGAGVLQDGEAVGLEGAIAPAAELDLLHLGAAVAQCDHALRPRLEPAQRPGELPCQPRHQELVGRAAELGAEAATHVGDDHAHGRLVEPEPRGERALHTVGVLAARPERESPVVAPFGRHGADLERARGDALVDHALAHHHLAPVEQVVVVTELEAHGDVGARVGEEHDLALLRGFGIDHHGQRLVVDEHQLGCVLTLVPLLGDDGYDRLTRETHDAVGEERPCHRLVEHGDGRRHRGEVDVSRGEHADDAGRGTRVVDVDRRNAGVGHGRAHVGHVRGPRQLQVVDVGRATREELGILLALDTVAKDAHASLSISCRA